MEDKERSSLGDEERPRTFGAPEVLCIVGTALAQTWVLVVGLVADMYRHGDLAVWTVGSMLLPFFIAFALVSGCFVAARIAAQWNRGIYGAVAGAAATVAGSVILLALHEMPGPAYLLWTLAGVLVGAGGALLFMVWSTRVEVLDSRRRTIVFFASIMLCGLLAAWAQYQGLGLVLPIATSLASIVSAVLFAISGKEAPASESVRPPLGLLPGFLRIAVAFALFGLVFAMMIMQFLIAPHGRPFSRTWVLCLLGILATLVFALAGRKIQGSEWNGLLMLRFAPLPVLVALFPFDAGSDFSLKFAMSGAAFTLWFFLALAPLVASSAAETLRLPFSLIWATAVGALALGASAGICIAAVIENLDILNHVSITAVVAMVLVVVASDILLTRGSLARIYKRAYMVAAEGQESSSEGALDRRVAMVANACGLTSRETDVLGILARGHGLSRVQEVLYIAEGTAITHRRHIYQKLGVHSKTELIDFVSHYGDEHTDED